MKTLLLILCLSLLVITRSSIAQDDLDTLKTLSLEPAWGDIAWNTQSNLFAVGGYDTLNIHDADFNVVDALENYGFGSAFVLYRLCGHPRLNW